MSTVWNENPTVRMRRYHQIFLRQLDLAAACVGALEVALVHRDRDRVSAILLDLHMARRYAEAALEECEQDASFAAPAARGALRIVDEATDRSLAEASELFAEWVLKPACVRDN